MSDPSSTVNEVIPVTEVAASRVANMRIGWVATCTATITPTKGRANQVTGICGNVTTHIRKVTYGDGLTRWRSVCPEHTEGEL